MFPTVSLALALALVPPAQTPSPAPPAPVAAATAPTASLNAARQQALETQVMLDRAGFSPGAIDGRPGGNTGRALEAYTRQGGSASTVAALVSYTVTANDVSAAFTPEIPDDLMAQSTLAALGYRDAAELLAERFHTTPAFLRELNPSATFAEGESLQVPNVEPFEPPAAAPSTPTTKTAAPTTTRPDVVITVSKATSSLTVTGTGGRTLFYAPVTTGSEHDPLPLGEWKVNGVQRNPTFKYNPELFWDADETHSKATIPAGPNNPVGVVWIDISKEHYGLHGTPAPEAVGHRASHGCVRLTNWDALKLAAMVKPGTRVLFVE